MASSEVGAALAAHLTDLKRRSGLSYEQLGRKAHLSRSTVHRYCTGRSVPTAFAPVEAIATACSASREELAKLYRLWERAELGRAPVPHAPDDDAVTDVPVTEEAAEAADTRSRPARGPLAAGLRSACPSSQSSWPSCSPGAASPPSRTSRHPPRVSRSRHRCGRTPHVRSRRSSSG